MAILCRAAKNSLRGTLSFAGNMFSSLFYWQTKVFLYYVHPDTRLWQRFNPSLSTLLDKMVLLPSSASWDRIAAPRAYIAGPISPASLIHSAGPDSCMAHTARAAIA